MRTLIKLKGQTKGSSKVETRRLSEAYIQKEILTWRPFRIFGVFSSLGAILFTVISVCSKRWLQGKGFHWSVWKMCLLMVTHHKTTEVCKDKVPAWQNVVIGLLIFSIAFGLLATTLSVIGVCSSSISKRIYYYHSAGEIYLVCGLCVMAALILYPAVINTERRAPDYQFGVGYGIAWGSVFFFFASALCMCLDDLVHKINRLGNNIRNEDLSV